VVELGVVAEDLIGLFDNGKHPRLGVVVAVGTDAKIDLVGILVGAVLGHQAEEGILGGLRDDLSREDGGSGRRHVAGNVLDSGER